MSALSENASWVFVEAKTLVEVLQINQYIQLKETRLRLVYVDLLASQDLKLWRCACNRKQQLNRIQQGQGQVFLFCLEEKRFRGTVWQPKMSLSQHTFSVCFFFYLVLVTNKTWLVKQHGVYSSIKICWLRLWGDTSIIGISIQIITYVDDYKFWRSKLSLVSSEVCYSNTKIVWKYC